MTEGLQAQAKLWLAGPVQMLGLWARTHLGELVTRLGARAPEPARQAAQRFGNGMWLRITTRFPGLAELLEVPGHGVPSGVPAAAPTATAPQQVARSVGVPQQARDVSALVRALRDPSAEAAAAAAAALAAPAAGDTEQVCRAALLDVLGNADGYFNPITRVAALQALLPRFAAESGSATFIPLLRAVRDLDAEVSLAAIAAIAELAPPALAIDTLLPIVLDDSGFFLPFVQHAAMSALERAGLLNQGQVGAPS
jgi:hypothetical protein